MTDIQEETETPSIENQIMRLCASVRVCEGLDQGPVTHPRAQWTRDNAVGRIYSRKAQENRKKNEGCISGQKENLDLVIGDTSITRRAIMFIIYRMMNTRKYEK